ncbi:MAG: hypothetical protein JHC98_12475, partial [Thermoleophilaceae bacterium]|nr:hypothetical protein [Thermoleophilaceae bacterium]
MTDKKPQYKTYRARRMPWDRFRRSQFDKLGEAAPPEPGDAHFPAPPPSRSRGDAGMQPEPAPRRAPRVQDSPQRQPKKAPRVKAPRASTRRPVVKFFKWFLIWAASWLLLSGVLFVVSATMQQSK